jgi:hypothetical protein
VSETGLEFCYALEEGRADLAAAIISKVISRLNLTWSDDPNFASQIEQLAEWLRRQICIENVFVFEGVLKTEPPQKVLSLTASIKGQRRSMTLKLCLGRNLQVHELQTES